MLRMLVNIACVVVGACLSRPRYISQFRPIDTVDIRDILRDPYLPFLEESAFAHFWLCRFPCGPVMEVRYCDYGFILLPS
jgi:hypothetical protein